ncbi:hypothetical protein AAMO2058_000268900 [Amorphochlora amoebiformis]
MRAQLFFGILAVAFVATFYMTSLPRRPSLQSTMARKSGGFALNRVVRGRRLAVSSSRVPKTRLRSVVEKSSFFGIDEREVSHIRDYLPDVKAIPSPLATKPGFRDDIRELDEKVMVDIAVCKGELCEDDARSFLRAGPREELYFDPKEVRVGIVTCGGLCPGLNSVIREVSNSLWYNYGVHDIVGLKYGLRGLRLDLTGDLEEHKKRFTMPLNPEEVAGIHQLGGTILGTGRGNYDAEAIYETIEKLDLNMLFIIGGDGTHAAADAIYQEARERGRKMSVVAIPKTIDNDINIIDRSFGFETSIEEAQRAILSAKVEASSSINGVGIVRLMGRHSGAITLMASLASNDVDISLIPEVDFNEEKFLEHLMEVLDRKGHAVVVAAEGMAEKVQASLQDTTNVDYKSGGATQSISGDIGQYLKTRIKDHLKSLAMEHRMINIDPTYMIRSIPANAGDKVYCTVLSQQAVHGAMAGYTGFSAGMVSTNYVYIPIQQVIEAGPRKVDPQGQMWYRLITSTQQPACF